ncbi:MAG: type I DNA topoisomerase [Clostridia bacterium]|nr:type I DNA topoisomerase [Clostridia bacterium]
MGKLVIVESPAKAKTIAKYLGEGYQVKASMGHLRDLPPKKFGVDVKKNFELTYIPIPTKDDVIRDLQKAAEKSEAVFLATDPDREGEAISWHLSKLLGLPEDLDNRVTFNEITAQAVRSGIANPRHIDIDLVDAQQARRALDRIVGYKLSPFLCKKIRRGLSAGRVQSVVTRLVVDREREIRAFEPEEYWSLGAKLHKGAKGRLFEAKYYGNTEGKVDLANEEQTLAIRNKLENAEFRVTGVKKSDKRRNPPPPFTTSTLQQDASRRLGMASKRSMAVAQSLYEGVELGDRGLTGLITYMRTDSVRLSDDAVSAVRSYISENFGDNLLPKNPRVFKAKGGAQDAHEAVRPTDVNLTPAMLKADLTNDQYRLYKLIWERFVACQMAVAVYDAVSIEIMAEDEIFRASGQTVKVPGFTTLYEEKGDNDEKSVSLPALEEGDVLKLQELIPAQHFTEPPPRYNEASLIKTMEEKGIGRPSTYASTISTILDRAYVEREGKALKATPLGEAVTDLMIQRFSDIVNVRFTAGMEASLDRVETGEASWTAILHEFYDKFAAELKKAEVEMKEQRITVPEEETDEICELCGQKMVIKYGRFGRFLSCKAYPECKNAKPIIEDTGGKCPLCGGRVAKRFSRKKKAFYICENNKGKDQGCSFITWDQPLTDLCPKCGKTLFKHNYRGEKDIRCLNEGCDYKQDLKDKKEA